MADLRVRMTLDGAAFLQGVTSMRQGLNTTFSGLQSQLAAAFSVGAITALSHRTIQYAGHMRDLSDRLGVNVEWLQKMANTAALAGGSVDDLANLMNELGRSRQEALTDPKSKSAQSLSRMGFTSADISGLSQQQFVEKLIKAFGNGASLQIENDLIEVGGRSAKKLLAAFSQGFDEGGPVMPEWVIDELDNVGDSFTRLGQSLMVDFGPAIVFAIDMVKQFSERTRQYIAGLGGLSSHMNARDLIKAQGSGLGIWYVAGKMIKGWKDFQDETNKVASEQENRNDSIAIAQEAARKRRREREKSPPNFDLTSKEKEAQQKIAKVAEIKSDSLVAVGNFLGATNRNNIESIQRETNNLIRETNRILSRIAELRGGTSDPFGIPGT